MACGDHVSNELVINIHQHPATSSFSQGAQCPKDHHHEVLDLHGEGQTLEISIFAYMLVQDLGEQSSSRRDFWLKTVGWKPMRHPIIQDRNGDPSASDQVKYPWLP